MQKWKLLLVLFIGIGVVACGGQAIPTEYPSPTDAPKSAVLPTATLSSVNAPYRTIKIDGQLVFAPGDGSIWLQDASTFQSKALLKATRDVYYEAPTFSPDGSQIAFVAYTFGATGAQVKQIRVINVDGSNPRTLYRASANGPEISFGDPRYSPDGQSLYFTATTSNGTGAEGRKNQIVRGPAAGGNPQLVLDGGQQPTLSPDAKQMAFLKFNPQRFASSLWIANADGSGATQLLADNVFAGINGQRFSPDGKWIVFAASGLPRQTLPGMASQQPKQENCVLLGCLVPTAYADGLPWDIWLVSTDGKTFKQLTELGMDSPYPVFSKDGRYIAFVSLNGLFVYDRQSSDLSELDRERVHGVLDWFQK